MTNHIASIKTIRTAIQSLVDNGNIKAFIAATGAGAGIVNMIWQTPGCSSLLMGFNFPYNQSQLADFIGYSPKSACSEDTAIAMAQAAYFKAQESAHDRGDLAKKGVQCIGIGLTAAAETNRQLKGGTRFFVAMRADSAILAIKFTLQQGLLGRSGDGQVCDIAILNMMLLAMAVHNPVKLIPIYYRTLGITHDGAPTSGQNLALPRNIQLKDPLSSFHDMMLIEKNGETKIVDNLDPQKHIIFPGSFNPAHFGHIKLARLVEEISGREVVFEISATNIDKETIDIKELQKRALLLRGVAPAIISRNTPLFIQKIKTYNGCDFLVGIDTLKRIFDRTHYHDAALHYSQEYTKFYVSSRIINGREESLKDLMYDYIHYQDRYKYIPIHSPKNISSTELRATQQ